MKIPETKIPIVEIPVQKNIQLFMKREDLIHSKISGNKFWKLFYNIKTYLDSKHQKPMIITFGGAFSNHISAVSAVGKELQIPTLGIIRGEELQNKWQDNSTLKSASENGMTFQFVTREEYRDKEKLSKILQNKFPQSLIIPEGGTNELAVQGVQHMLNNETKSFDYLCAAVGTGGTIAGIRRYAEENQKVLGFKVVADHSLQETIAQRSGSENFELMNATNGHYGKIIDKNIRFINNFYEKFGIKLDPVYTGKMMQKLFQLIDEDFFPENSKILVFHTGGLQGILGANTLLAQQNREEIRFRE